MSNLKKKHIITNKEIIGTWLGLIILTILTVAISIVNAHLMTITVVTALTIASTKALLVAYYYMHLKFEKKIYRLLVLIVVIIFALFMLLTIIDYISR